MKDLRIVFMGTPDFAVTTLKTLVKNNYNIVGVITAPDKPAGRGQKLNESAVKQYAVSQNLTVLQPTNLKSADFLNELTQLNANLQIVVAFRMLPKVVWQMPKYGTFNLHASLLPNYRGAAPINWAIINGETKTGVSTFFIDEKIDTGDMILQDSIAINPEENAGSLHDKLMHIGSELVLKTVELIQQDSVKTIPQTESSDIKTAYKLDRDNCKIDWNDSLENIYNLIRGLSPYPAAWCTLINGDDTLDIKIYAADKESASHNYSIGTIISTKNELKVAVSKGYIIIKEIKLPGKRTMDTKSLLNGYNFEADAKMC
ncbi:Methionyl-tRNA formyltransferase [Mariniflexile rhizosphaerae]|uniref:methionyl-tRNA formyltransferase n=1 Tax=unclassified Mariniflexile TaxID=2643887 RepID=UPI000CB5DA57|nr:methionyl-tRNA formyltransferase [Mariniflexile sp. TRM1-10]AXP82979.1 Methionyl-tRNA formyltransferase [Mariniflexile sp. TRM1-10]PLB19651.1 MAG: Methionyl-tRNA formyltransferase [Flavobacteriaceae bacterium FS1-H7996/R]